MEWKSMQTAPRDGRMVKLKTAGGYVFRASFSAEVEGEAGSCTAWAAGDEDEHPPCWSDGICWAVNADGQRSDPPIGWRPVRQQPPTLDALAPPAVE